MASSSDKIVIQVTQIFIGVCLLVMAAAGSANTIAMNTKGIKTQAQILEVVLDQKYRTTNFKRHEDFYRVNVQYTDGQGKVQTQWAQATPEEKSQFNIEAGKSVPFIYIPGSERSDFGTQLPSWTEMIIWDSVCVSLGIFLIAYALIKGGA